MKKLHLLTAAGVLGLMLSGSAIARQSDAGIFYHAGPSSLVAITFPDPQIANARVTDGSGANTLGAVQAVSFDDKGHAVQVEMAFLNQDHTVTLDADRFLYDRDSNSLILARP